MKNRRQNTIATEPADVYSVLAELVKSRRLSVRESAAVSYAMGVMEHTFPSAIAQLEG